MCLQTVKWQGNPIYHKVRHAWKIFTRPNYGMYHGGPYKSGEWYLADTTIPDLVFGGKYEIGFHAYQQREDAIEITEVLQDELLVIYLVQLLGIKVIGGDYRNRRCFVADWMRPVEQLSIKENAL